MKTDKEQIVNNILITLIVIFIIEVLLHLMGVKVNHLAIIIGAVAGAFVGHIRNSN